jgi:hypothetical protein
MLCSANVSLFVVWRKGNATRKREGCQIRVTTHRPQDWQNLFLLCLRTTELWAGLLLLGFLQEYYKTVDKL